MTTPDATPTSFAAVLDILNGLVEGQMSSIFRFLEEGAPYLSRASAALRRPLGEMVQAHERHTAQLMALIDDLGGAPPRETISAEEQYMAFLSFKFLLPKLVEAKKLAIERYENALNALGADAPPQVIHLLKSHLEDHQDHLQILEQAAEQAKEE